MVISETNNTTINKLFAESVKRFGDREFLRSKVDGQWRSLTYKQVWDKVKDLALGLYSLGVKPEDRIAIWSENRPEWNIADLAVLALGAADVPIYTTQARNQIEYILRDASARAIFVSKSLLAQAIEIAKSVPSLELVIALDQIPVEYRDEAVMTLDEIVEKGRALGVRAHTGSERNRDLEHDGSGSEADIGRLASVRMAGLTGQLGLPTGASPQTGEIRSFDELASPRDRAARASNGQPAEEGEQAGNPQDIYDSLRLAVRPDDLATQMYTSGTTGEPKGVMLSHRNLSANALNSYRWLELEGRNDTAVTYLPLSHIFERGVWYLYMYAGIIAAYAQSIDTVAADLADVRPTVMTSVPRMFEKMYA
ncbi:MAG: AMP-binding protein, partial [Blastocatellia bacterium]